jgi:membrane-bound lytic murein transglycosylase A
VDSELDAFLLQVQGSGRVQLPTGDVIRLQYADQNGHPYQSIGRYLVERGELTVGEVTMPGIRQWLDANPARVVEVLNSNPSFVFFNEERLDDPGQGPKGAQGVPLTGGRSIAIDPASVPLGAPVFLDTSFPATDRPLQRLVMAQDTGGAIRGVVRADFFWGTGHEAGEQAGRMRQPLRMWMLWPKGMPLPAG